MTRTRWLVIAVGLTAYWSVTGREIARARAAPRPMYFTWWVPGLLTCPLGAIADGSDAGARSANTAVTVAGALLNGLIFGAVVRRWYWPHSDRPLSDVARDYTDGPNGVAPDGRVGPRAG